MGTSDYHCLIKSLQLMKVMSSWSHREEKFFIFSCFSRFQVSDLASAGPKWRDTSYGFAPPSPQEKSTAAVFQSVRAWHMYYGMLVEPYRASSNCTADPSLSHTSVPAWTSSQQAGGDQSCT